VAASGEDALDTKVAAAARDRGVPVNVVDRPDLSTFVFPAIVDRGEVVAAVSTGGAAPVLARRLRQRIERALPDGVGRLAAFARAFRPTVAALVPTTARRRFWEEVFDGPVAAAVLAGDPPKARERMMRALNRARRGDQGAVGRVLLVGAGPGDPDLLTLKALNALHDADAIVYDDLVDERILGLARRDAERIAAGKRKGRHRLSQDAINALLVARARAGQTVVRLKGGDPMLFGRGGEELAYLRAYGIDVEVIPGITAALGCGAAAGLALTHRDHAHAVTFVTGHRAQDGDTDWRALAAPGHTVVVYMGASSAAAIAERLIGLGRDPETPAAIIENGTRPEQRVLTGRLADLGGLAEGVSGGPALIVIGEVVASVAADVVAPAVLAVAV